MEDKTEELRDIFLDVSDGEKTVVDRQQGDYPPDYGESNNEDSESVDDRIEAVISDIEESGLETSLSRAELVEVVRGYFTGLSDQEIATSVGDSSLDKTVRRARVQLHLFRAEDFDAPMEWGEFRSCIREGMTVRDCADRFDVGKSTVGWYRRVVVAQNEAIDQEWRNYIQFREVIFEDGD